MAKQDIQVLTGVNIPHSTQQRFVHRHEFPDVIVSETVQEMSIDGAHVLRGKLPPQTLLGKVRLRTPLGEPCIWNDYKAIRLHKLATTVRAVYFKENAALVDWANQQPLATPLFGLGDGHDGIWNLFEGIGTLEQRYEILDWYHLKENLYNIPGCVGRIKQVKALLWKGNVDAAIEAFNGCVSFEAVNFVAHLQKHRSRIPHYEYLQHEGVSIESGAVESAVKQIARQVKLSGAQWDVSNVPQLLKHRCAYLGYFETSPQSQNVA